MLYIAVDGFEVVIKVPKNSLRHNKILERQETNDDGGEENKRKMLHQAPAIRKERSLLQTLAYIRPHALCENLPWADPDRRKAKPSNKVLPWFFPWNVILTSGA